MTATGRAELLHAWAVGGEDGLTAMARLLGYDERREAEPQRVEEARTGEVSSAARHLQAVSTEAERAPDLAPIPFWVLDEVESLEPELEPTQPPAARPIGLAGLGRRPGKPPPTPPLTTDARLVPALRRRLASQVPSRELDVKALVEAWSRGRRVRRLPWRPLAAWAPKIVVLVDRSARLVPFWDDQDRLLRRLRHRLGAASLHEIRYLEGWAFPWRDGRHRYRRPAAELGAAVLALSDLGFLASETDRALWRQVGERLERTGVRRTALVLCPPSRWDAGVVRRWDVLDWERPRGAPRFGRDFDEDARRDRAERLLALLAFASRVEPGLLRAARSLLDAAEADAGTEVDAWTHPEVAGGFVPAAALGTDLRSRLQARFAEMDDEVKRSAVKALRAWRAGLPEEIWRDEVLALEAAGRLPPGTLSKEEIAAAREMWQQIAETVGGGAPADVDRAVKAFVGRTLRDRLPLVVWNDPELRPALWRAWEASWDGEGEPPLPAGVGPEVRGGKRGPLRRWQAWQVGGYLRFVPAGQDPPSGSPLVTFESTLAEVDLLAEGERFTTPSILDVSIAVPFPEALAIVLRTDRTHAVLRRFERPEWADAAGRDRFGLWADFDVDGVRQRMRYIPAGRFRMGSPEDEPGRWDAEGPRHLETVTHGFWLADTPCTQALWQAVMGENPSEFQSTDRPVETVSWKDCKSFFEALGERVPSLDARFPTEAEWEYACRAGTETATWVGPMEILGERNAPVLDDIAWYGGNSGDCFELESGYDSSGWKEKQYPHKVAGTRPVARKDPNPWGLYDMLGSVYEWCEDRWRQNYDARPEGTSRVYRGGSWHSLARYVRAAFRFRFVPSDRWSNLGFRLALGPSALEPVAKTLGTEHRRMKGQDSRLDPGPSAFESVAKPLGTEHRRRKGQGLRLDPGSPADEPVAESPGAEHRRDEARKGATRRRRGSPPKVATFSDYVRALGPDGEPPDAESFDELLDRLRAVLVHEMKKRGLWQAPPSYLGAYGGTSWSDGDLLEDLTHEAYLFVFVHRLAGLRRQLLLRSNIDGLVFLNLRHFLHETQKRHDPLGFRVFEVAHDAVSALLEAGRLHVLEGEVKVRSSTVLGFGSGADARQAEDVDLRLWIAGWCDELLPDLITAWTRGEVVAQLAERLAGLREDRVEAFRFGDLVEALKDEVRARWQAAGRLEHGEVALEEDGAFGLVRAIRPDSGFEERQAFDTLLADIQHRIDTSVGNRESRDDLHRLWLFLRNWVADEESEYERWPSDKRLSEILDIPRARIRDLKAHLGILIEEIRVRSQAMTFRSRTRDLEERSRSQVSKSEVSGRSPTVTRYRSHPLDRGHPPSWASGWGEDRFGVFVSFSVEGVEQRLRWIEPGSFWMGSPETEEGRYDDEVRHHVTLTRGFWLADTPCTQALWQAVMGENPSRFPSSDRPVEQVSWEDGKKFFDALEKRVPGLGARYPTEAEWEYACRAGTETATWAGDLETAGACNAPLLDAIAWYAGNSGEGFELESGVDSRGWPEKQYPHTRAGTRPVTGKAPNPWGLYDMLGNIYEWCEDRYGSYEGGSVTDPTGPPKGSDRVDRGGSWYSFAQFVRAAYRIRCDSSLSWFDLGFRLALGQVALEPGGVERRKGPREAAEDRRSKARDEPA